MEVDVETGTRITPQARLTAPSLVLVGEFGKQALEPQRPMVIGRRPECDVTLDTRDVSRQHVEVLLDDDGVVWVTDLDSVNGTFLDRKALTPHHPTQFRPGQTLTVGLASSGHHLTLQEAEDLVIDLTHATSTVMPHQTLTIGRSADNTLQLADPQVSRHHARATPHGDSFLIEDLDSSNGTFLDGQLVTSAVAGEGSLVTVGRSSFLVENGRLVHWTQTSASLRAERLTVTLDGNKTILDDVSFDLPSSQLMAVIGPSGAGKTTLLRALTGSRPASAGTVWCDGRDLYAQYNDLKHRIGVVPQDDIVHAQLTVCEALTFAAELRFSDDLERAARQERVTEVIDQLQLTAHRDTPVSRLSGGQRKRVSVAMELLTEPSLLFLDEPTSGLDPGLDKTVMQLLRSLADDGRTVVVITHNTANLGLCDRVLLMAPGGSVAFDGPPQDLLEHFDATDMAEVFQQVTAHPQAHRQVRPATPPPAAPLDDAVPRPRGRSRLRQYRTLLHRQVKIVSADRSYALATIVLPVILALMTLTIPGEHGLGPHQDGPKPEATRLLVIMMVGASFMGAAATIRELVAERAIFLRERAVGLSPAAYLASKVGFAAVLTLIQGAVLVGLVLAFKPGPASGVMMPGAVELIIAAALTAFAAACLALLLSAWVGSAEQVMPALVVMVMGQLVLCGGLIDVTDRAGLSQLSWLTPARWGYSAAASTLDLSNLTTTAPDDAHWRHTTKAWWLNISALLVLCAASSVLTLARLRRTRPTT